MTPEDFLLEMGPEYKVSQGLIDQWFELAKRLNQGTDNQDNARLPSLLDIEAGLKNAQGKCVVNSISLTTLLLLMPKVWKIYGNYIITC